MDLFERRGSLQLLGGVAENSQIGGTVVEATAFAVHQGDHVRGILCHDAEHLFALRNTPAKLVQSPLLVHQQHDQNGGEIATPLFQERWGKQDKPRRRDAIHPSDSCGRALRVPCGPRWIGTWIQRHEVRLTVPPKHRLFSRQSLVQELKKLGYFGTAPAERGTHGQTRRWLKRGVLWSHRCAGPL